MVEEAPSKEVLPFKSTEGTTLPFQFSNTPSTAFDNENPANSFKRVSEEEHLKKSMRKDLRVNSYSQKSFPLKSSPGSPTNSSLASADAST
ncbi:hypothetical protein DSO57_1033241 [Entomophthora muscae]|uniref:Uncharacterized protein n=1 Tax=Entomophthora muscae TaxID=34485 RepID=A0ACC2RR67_9FUNG|nr:hypothetical protein DSO57_1033241 [Entomophthora muscae]